jgi:hypothetical protein
MVKASIHGVELEIFFTPSFNIKTTDKRVEQLLRTSEVEVFDPWKMKVRKVKATKGVREAYLVLEHFRVIVPEANIKIHEMPELQRVQEEGATN